jgi:hypothetical protein
MKYKGKYQIINDYGVHFYDFNAVNILHIFYDSYKDAFLINQFKNDGENSIFDHYEEDEYTQIIEIDDKTFANALLDSFISFKIEDYI